ncbi:unnamed protein product [Prorocentrum cordatum]|uniref:Uncharacterized protein n=1 Tax=Prorocentrum cordatum TaxID=2364126 RepID=A0ABN9SE16_9DINO|nr:unnamed protein product [Polarella glacialis]
MLGARGTTDGSLGSCPPAPRRRGPPSPARGPRARSRGWGQAARPAATAAAKEQPIFAAASPALRARRRRGWPGRRISPSERAARAAQGGARRPHLLAGRTGAADAASSCSAG